MRAPLPASAKAASRGARVVPRLVANHDASPKNHQRTVENQNAPGPFAVNSTLFAAMIIGRWKHAWLSLSRGRQFLGMIGISGAAV
jgi:hypothetical protein